VLSELLEPGIIFGRILVLVPVVAVIGVASLDVMTVIALRGFMNPRIAVAWQIIEIISIEGCWQRKGAWRRGSAAV